MSEEEKVYCPYCGGEMELNHYGIDDDEAFAYACRNCASVSPISYSAESALATALARPMQKPMTRDEVIEALKDNDFIAGWFEWKEDPEPTPCTISDWDLEMLHEIGVRFPEETEYGDFDIRDNGREYRIWRQMPTDEERDAAKWEVE